MQLASLKIPECYVSCHDDYPAFIDILAEHADTSHAFLRASWYRAFASGQTLVATRDNGTVAAALPFSPIGSALMQISGVVGCYWPFRSALLHADATACELADILCDPVVFEKLAPAWRMGPAYLDARTTQLVMQASARAGWTVLVRELGKTWIFDLAEAADRNGGNWPRKSSRKRLAAYERTLMQQGELSYRFITGSDWSPGVLEALAQVERESWVGQRTDGKGAKFLRREQREQWQTALQDPEMAKALSAAILYLDDRPVAFSFDLRSGDIQYAIAGSYAEDMAEFRVGKIVTYRQLEAALQHGIRQVDLGAGDSGYKREMGAIEGSDVVDLLFVRYRKAAQLLAKAWGPEPAHLRKLTLASPHRVEIPLVYAKQISAAALAASAVIAIAE